MAKRKNPKQPFAVGSRVMVAFGVKDVEATVIEDRGPVGMGGRWLIRVRVEIEGVDEPFEFELPVVEVKRAA